jgi:hypothetical protein
MNLQAFGISALECLQSQNLSHPENRLSLKALAIVHGRQVSNVVVVPGAASFVVTLPDGTVSEIVMSNDQEACKMIYGD